MIEASDLSKPYGDTLAAVPAGGFLLSCADSAAELTAAAIVLSRRQA
jgi:hypothetical protein